MGAAVSVATRPSFALGPMPLGRPMVTVDERFVRAPVREIFAFARDVEHWPVHLRHYRWVRFRERSADGGGIVEMAAWRPFGPLRWPTWWVSRMAIDAGAGEIRYRHIRGITRGMNVVWQLSPLDRGARVDIAVEHAWSGPPWPLVGAPIAGLVIGPVFIHGIASRTLAGLKRHLEEA
jgi:hypothetical protein